MQRIFKHGDIQNNSYSRQRAKHFDILNAFLRYTEAIPFLTLSVFLDDPVVSPAANRLGNLDQHFNNTHIRHSQKHI